MSSEVPIPEEAVGEAAEAIRTRCAHDEFYDTAELAVRAAAPLIVAASRHLPKPDRREDECGVDGGYWDLKHATGVRGDWVQSYAIDGVPVVYDSPGPDGMYSVEEMRERCFAGLAACEDAERLAAEQSASVLRGEGQTDG
jgi:hypothetical protein